MTRRTKAAPQAPPTSSTCARRPTANRSTGRSTVTGRRIADCGLRIADSTRGALSFRLRRAAREFKDERLASLNPQSAIRNPQSKGFTLLELMIVISILVILAMIAMAQYNRTVLAAKEATLHEDLFTLRNLIVQYAAYHAKLPQSLDDLHMAGYMQQITVDPTPDGRDWQLELGH